MTSVLGKRAATEEAKVDLTINFEDYRWEHRIDIAADDLYWRSNTVKFKGNSVDVVSLLSKIFYGMRFADKAIKLVFDCEWSPEKFLPVDSALDDCYVSISKGKAKYVSEAKRLITAFRESEEYTRLLEAPAAARAQFDKDVVQAREYKVALKAAQTAYAAAKAKMQVCHDQLKRMRGGFPRHELLGESRCLCGKPIHYHSSPFCSTCFPSTS